MAKPTGCVDWYLDIKDGESIMSAVQRTTVSLCSDDCERRKGAVSSSYCCRQKQRCIPAASLTTPVIVCIALTRYVSLSVRYEHKMDIKIWLSLL